jgi:hypothetical protein
MQREPCPFFRRGELDLAAVRAGNFGSYVETEAEALVRRPTVSAKEGLKQLSFDNVIDRVALVRDCKRESLFISRRLDTNRPAGSAVLHRVGDKVRSNLSDALRVAVDRMRQIDSRLDGIFR